MFRFIETKRYDIQRSFGTDWHLDYVFESDNMNLTIEEAISLLKSKGYNPCGELTLKYSKKDNLYTLETVMY